jgi:hypothetical protein
MQSIFFPFEKQFVSNIRVFARDMQKTAFSDPDPSVEPVSFQENTCRTVCDQTMTERADTDVHFT